MNVVPQQLTTLTKHRKWRPGLKPFLNKLKNRIVATTNGKTTDNFNGIKWFDKRQNGFEYSSSLSILNSNRVFENEIHYCGRLVRVPYNNEFVPRLVSVKDVKTAYKWGMIENLGNLHKYGAVYKPGNLYSLGTDRLLTLDEYKDIYPIPLCPSFNSLEKEEQNRLFNYNLVQMAKVFTGSNPNLSIFSPDTFPWGSIESGARHIIKLNECKANGWCESPISSYFKEYLNLKNLRFCELTDPNAHEIFNTAEFYDWLKVNNPTMFKIFSMLSRSNFAEIMLAQQF